MLLTKQVYCATDSRSSSGALVGVCIGDDHPTLSGRCLVHWRDSEGGHEKWLPCLSGVKPEVHDHLLVLQADNAGEPIVVGVVDGLREKEERGPVPGPAVQLKAEEALHVLGADGTPLLEVRQGEKGPVLRLLSEDLELEVAGELRVKAKSIAMAAQRGEVKIEAAADVVVKGEVIQLN